MIQAGLELNRPAQPSSGSALQAIRKPAVIWRHVVAFGQERQYALAETKLPNGDPPLSMLWGDEGAKA